MKSWILPRSRICRRVLGILILLGLADLCACSEPSNIPLASVDRLGPRIVEPGDVISIRGTGFVEGPAQVVLTGEFKPAGMATPKRKSVVLEGAAVSNALIEVSVTPKTMRALASEPTRFNGAIEVSFPSIEPLGFVSVAAEKTHVTFDLTPAGGAVPLTARRSRDAARFLSDLGIGVSKPDELLIGDVRAETPAARAGLQSGDRLLAVNGTALASLADLGEMERQSTLCFEVVSNLGIMREVELSRLRHTPLSRDELAAIVLSAMALGLFLALVAPSASRRSDPAATSKHLLARTIGFGAVSVPVLLLPAVAVYTRAGFNGLAALYGITAFGLSALTILQPGNLFKRVFTLVMRLAPVPLLVCITGVCGSTVELNNLVASQQTAPWGWHVWSSPFALAAVFAGVSLIWSAGIDGQGTRSRAASASAWLSAIPAAMIISACCLGGWLVPGVQIEELSSNGWFLAAGCLVFFAKTQVVLFASRWFASVGQVERRSWGAKSGAGLRFCVLAAATALAMGWITLDLPEMILACGQVLATAAFATFFTAFVVLSVKRILSGSAIPLVERSQNS